MRLEQASCRVAAALACWLASVSSGAPAQDPRALLEEGRRAYNEFADYDRAVGLLTLGLNPAGPSRDSLWVDGVHILVDALTQLGDSASAQVWTRWAVRLDPSLRVDTLNYSRGVGRAFEEARRAVAASLADQASAQVSWVWPVTMARPTSGAILLEGADVSLNGRIEGGDFVTSGSTRTLAAGTYTILATAEGFLPARATVEVLPGTTTVLSFRLQPAQAGYLYVASRPWGNVFVNGERVGYTTLAGHRLAAGVYRVRVARDGYVPFDTVVTVQQDQAVRLGPIQLRPRAP